MNTPSINRYINPFTLHKDSCESSPSPVICSARDCDNWVNDTASHYCSTCRPRPAKEPMTGYELRQAESANPSPCSSCGFYYAVDGDKCMSCINQADDLRDLYSGIMH